MNFDTTINQVGITSQNSGEEFVVSEAGDYLLTYSLVIDFSDLDPPDEGMIVRVDDTPVNNTNFSVGGGDFPTGTYTVSFIVSLSANSVVSLTQDGGPEGEGGVSIGECFFTIVRLGDSAG